MHKQRYRFSSFSGSREDIRSHYLKKTVRVWLVSQFQSVKDQATRIDGEPFVAAANKVPEYYDETAAFWLAMSSFFVIISCSESVDDICFQLYGEHVVSKMA